MIRVALRRAQVKPAASGEAREICLASTHRVSLTTRPVEATDYKVRLEIFEGPLDLLLYLIKKDEVDIHSISIERITRQYLDYINTFKLLNIDLASEFIVMAANLMYLKSRTLLPRVDQPPEEDAEEDDPRWELIRQLIEYKKFKDAAGFLSLRELEQEGRFAHQPEAADLPEPKNRRPSPKFPFSTSSAPSRTCSNASRNPMISAISSTTASPSPTRSSCSWPTSNPASPAVSRNCSNPPPPRPK